MSRVNDWRQDTWCRYLPALHRQLACSDIDSGLPRSFVSLGFEDTCAWWETLRYLFRALLGWRSLPAGLAWWYEAGLKDQHDPRLLLVLDRWNTRKELDFFAAREWETGGYTGMEGGLMTVVDEPHEPRPGWWQELRERPDFEEPCPWGGGYNPLHLGHSDEVGLARFFGDSMGVRDLATRRAVLVVDDFESWRRELEQYGAGLPELGDRSWHVEVFNHEVGYLGVFRKSRVTGIWFQGQHSLHMAGNPG